ncbi:MAG: hypothetical protein EXX96DRAFT_557979, partial [Benjaminiella poitrasii]
MVPASLKAVDRTIKMNLRNIMSLDNQKIIPDFTTEEIAKDISKSKFYTDKLKTVLSSKMDLNQFIESFPKSYENTLPIYISFFIIAEIEATVCVLYSGFNGLYIINKVTNISLPTTLLEVKDGARSSLNAIKLNQTNTKLHSVKKRKTVKKLTVSQVSNNEDKADLKERIRPVWFPPKHESDSDDA